MACPLAGQALGNTRVELMEFEIENIIKKDRQ
jgi:hypothetical protein